MKFGIIASSLADLHIAYITQHYDHEYHIFLDNRFGQWGCLSREDSLDRLNQVLSSKQATSCDAFILPPLYELYALQTSDVTYAANIIPLYTTYVQEYVLPSSVVGKIGLLAPLKHQTPFQRYWNKIVESYNLLPKQQTNKHFQKHFPLYTAAVDHWDILYGLSRSRFVNKLIKLDLKKLKDYGIDTLLPTSYAYFKHEKVFTQAFHNKVKVHKWSNLERIAKKLVGVDISDYSVHIHITGDDTLLDADKDLVWCLCRGKQHTLAKDILSMS